MYYMKKIIIMFILLVLLFVDGTCQVYDKKYKEEHYISYFSTIYRQPVVVAYKLYKGGGDCDRSGLSFKGDIFTASAKDYRGTKDPLTKDAKYDQGHMANAEDFAYNCDYQKSTFKFYNAVPQLVSLNRASWKHYEKSVRDLSQTDSLLVICFNVFSNKKLNNSQCYIPDYCIKIVKSLKTRQIVYALIFSNMEKIDAPKITTYQMLNAEYDFTIIDKILNTNKIDVE
jgi:endonuclease G